ncbi:hypothetical protein SPRG_14022 [Saprolegnia parasitica CBS 223.65]|uniref:Elicitin n=1 Tax=Saprolegnia parasitica (strain CBS 223.65) TaxID=695850 RepID=A0A067C2Z9_SAPPC|nr:hypothetical protein SPRG_14022 [Saprolegnia parasitica CBS 223.65]KDO20931.1 hypothetical protein SPRG_14022 [Saprolegnia parasitica CBS 223.65]|eukprot:XP_012208323.1 hypothetical protein SPRG_14022 [Saprolegnia parasitica CBS 223.65]
MAAAVRGDTPCDVTKLVTSFGSVLGAATACQSESGYTFLPPSKEPTAANIEAICASPACVPLLPALSSIPNCSVGAINIGAFAAAVNASCGNKTAAPTTAPPVATPKPTSSALPTSKRLDHYLGVGLAVLATKK